MSTGPLLKDKVVVVTGAGGGIGASIARLAGVHGAKVVVNDLGGGADGEGSDPGPAQAVADDIVKAGGSAVASHRSIADWDSAHAIIDDAVKAFGRVDAVVNNAGVVRDVIFHKMEKKDWDIVRSVNLDGYFYVSRAAAPLFKAQNSGCFVHMTSTSGLIGNLGQANYGAAKLGVTGLSKCIALDMQKFNVRSNCIAPFAFTRISGTIPANNEANIKRLNAMKQMTPEKIAPLVVALVSDAAQDISGQIFASRNNELFLFSQTRPLRSVQTSEGWSAEKIIETALPAFRGSAYPLHRSADVFTWNPV